MVNVTEKHVSGSCTTTDCLLVYSIVIFIEIMLLNISKIKGNRYINENQLLHSLPMIMDLHSYVHPDEGTHTIIYIQVIITLT